MWNLNFTWFVSSDLPARAPESEHLLRCEAHFYLELQCQGGLLLEDRLSMGLLRLECKKLREEIEEIKVCSNSYRVNWSACSICLMKMVLVLFP